MGNFRYTKGGAFFSRELEAGVNYPDPGSGEECKENSFGFRVTSKETEVIYNTLPDWRKVEAELLDRVNWHRGFEYEILEDITEVEVNRGGVKLVRIDPHHPTRYLKVSPDTNEVIRIINRDMEDARRSLHDLYLDVGLDGLAYCAGIGMFFPFIPDGEFVMGSPPDEEGRYEDEKQRLVQIESPFIASMYTVTQGQYRAVMGKNPSHFSEGGDGKDRVRGLDTSDFPVEMVSWNDAQKFCNRLSDLAGREFRLPSEAEWEYACRAGTQTPFHYGKTLCSYQANFDGNHPYGGAPSGPYLERTSRVGSYEPNAFGLYDMHGNVWEWCQDEYKEGN